MGKIYEQLDDALAGFIGRQHVFFVGTAPDSPDGHLNVSPKGLDTFRIVSFGQTDDFDFARRICAEDPLLRIDAQDQTKIISSGGDNTSTVITLMVPRHLKLY